jgi:transcriptional regulator with XRE-family HTH domain
MSTTAVIPEWTLGWRLQRALAEAGVSVQEMADELGVSRGTISRWCNDHGEPSRGYLKLWSLRTGVDHDWLVSGDRVASPVGGTLQLSSSSAIPGNMRDDPPSTAEVKAIRRRIPLRAPRIEPLLRLAAA